MVYSSYVLLVGLHMAAVATDDSFSFLLEKSSDSHPWQQETALQSSGVRGAAGLGWLEGEVAGPCAG